MANRQLNFIQINLHIEVVHRRTWEYKHWYRCVKIYSIAKSRTQLSDWTELIDKMHKSVSSVLPLVLKDLYFFIFLNKVFIEFVAVLLLLHLFVFWPQGMWDPSSPTRDWTCMPCLGKWNLEHWTTRKSPKICFSKCVNLLENGH